MAPKIAWKDRSAEWQGKSTARAAHRVVLNRAMFDEINLGAADGLFAMAVAIVEAAKPPDPPAVGKGLTQGRGALAYVGGKKVAGTTIGGQEIKPPRAAKVTKAGVVAIGGFGFPGRLVELGSIHNTAKPFLTPALMSEQPNAGDFVKAAMARRIAKGRR